MTDVVKKLSDPESFTLTREGAGFREQGGEAGRRCGECYFNNASRCTRGIIGIDKIDADDVCNEFRHNLQDGSMSIAEAEATLAQMTTRTFDLFINRVSENEQTGTRSWFSTSSGVKRDLYDERMSVPLFNDFIKRIEVREKPPEPFTSKAWNGGLPYLGVAHYLDLDGEGIAGETVKVWRDGTHLKMKGTFQNNKVGNAVYESIKRDIEKDVPHDQRVRVSIAFVDWGHEHEGVGHFERKSLLDRCPYCEAGVGDKIYRKGHLVHLAATRRPAYPEADIQLEERSMSQRKEDAASIVGEELAEEMEKKSLKLTSRSADIDPNAIVVRQDEEEESPKEEMDEEELEESKKNGKDGEEDEEEEGMVYESLGGARTLDEADQFIANRSKDVPLLDSWAIFASVLANIAGEEKRTGIYRAVSDFQDRLDVMALRAIVEVNELIQSEKGAVDKESETSGGNDIVTKSEEVQTHPLDEALTVFKDQFDQVLADENVPAEQRLAALQEPFNKVAATVQRAAAGDAPEETAPANAEIGDMIVKAVQDAVSPVMAEVASLKAKVEAKSVKPEPPVRRSIQASDLQATQVVQRNASNSKYTPLRSIVRRSVGIQE